MKKQKLLRILILLLIIIGASSLNAEILVTIPDTTATSGDTIFVPIYLGELKESDNVFAFQFALSYDSEVLQFIGCETKGTLSAGWSSNTMFNIRENGDIEVGSFGVFNSLVGRGVLIFLQAAIVGEHGESTEIVFQQFLLNAGQPSCSQINGKVEIFAPQVSVDFIANLDSPITITVDGQKKVLPFNIIWYAGVELSIAVETPQYLNQGTRMVFDTWSDLGNISHLVAPVTDTVFQCNMELQHLLTIDSDHGISQGGGWYAQGDTASIVVDSLVNSGDTTRFILNGWMGTGEGSYTGKNYQSFVIMNSPVHERAQWSTQFYVSINSPFGNPVGEGWYEQGDTVEIEIDWLFYVNETKRFSFCYWQGKGEGGYSGSLPVAQIVVISPINETAVWTTQFYLSAISTPMEVVKFAETGWYEKNTEVDITAPDSINLTELKFRFSLWMQDGENIAQNPITVLMDTSHQLIAVYQIDSVLAEIKTNRGNEILIFVDGKTFAAPYAAFWGYHSAHLVAVDTSIFLANNLSRYVFDSWNDGKDASRRIVADSAINITALFFTQHYLEVGTQPAGLLSFDESGWYVEGDSIQISEAPQQVFTESDSFKFNSWLVDGRPVKGNPIKVVMNTHHLAEVDYENLYFISGTVSQSRGFPVNGAELYLSGAIDDTVISNENGDYFFSSLAKGDYLIRLELENFRFEPPYRQYSQLQKSQNEQNFLAIDISPPEVLLLYPNGGQWLKQATIDTIKWMATDNVGIDSIAIQMTADGGGSWQKIAEIDSGIFDQLAWLIPDTISHECLIKISVFDFDGNEATDISDSIFSIGSTVSVDGQLVNSTEPAEFKVEQNYPNPFNSTTIISFHLPKNNHVTIEIFNMNGQKVCTLAATNFKSGKHRVVWDGRNYLGEIVSSGIYLYRVEAERNNVIKKFLYVR